MKNAISNILAILWFFGVLMWTVISLFIGNIMIFFMDIVGMLKTGFTTSTIGFAFLFIAGLVFAITGWVPAFRRCYYKLPWLYPLSMMLTMHLGILSIAETILAKGFEVISTPRHVATIVIMIIQVIVCRVLMCIYLKKNPMVLHKYDRVE
jgi:lysylphosphatidylglycerol synthetase-like protein (DUF2156 family)